MFVTHLYEPYKQGICTNYVNSAFVRHIVRIGTGNLKVKVVVLGLVRFLLLHFHCTVGYPTVLS